MELKNLADSNGRSLSYIMLNLRKGARNTPKRIGKRGWQWDLLETASEVLITGMQSTPESEIQSRKKYGVRLGSEKP